MIGPAIEEIYVIGLRRVGLKSIREAVMCASKIWVILKWAKGEEITLIPIMMGSGKGRAQVNFGPLGKLGVVKGRREVSLARSRLMAAISLLTFASSR
jgi:hypothetical protein